MVDTGKRNGPNERTRPWHGADSTWMRNGACADLTAAERRQFFQDDHTEGAFPAAEKNAAKLDVLEAKARCWECPVQQTCLDYALAHRMQGVWGGTTGKERRLMLKNRASSLRA